MSDPIQREPINGTSLTLEGQGGATLRANPSMRKVDIFAIQEDEFEILTSINDKAKFFSSAAALFLGAAATIFVSAMFSGIETDIARFATWVMAPLLLLVTGVFFFFSVREIRSGKTLVDRIKKQSTAANV